MELRTFQEWSDSGFKISKGAKATWVDGIAKFTREQVSPKPANSRGGRGISGRVRRSELHVYSTPGYHYRDQDYDLEAERDSPWYDDAVNASWGRD